MTGLIFWNIDIFQTEFTLGCFIFLLLTYAYFTIFIEFNQTKKITTGERLIHLTIKKIRI